MKLNKPDVFNYDLFKNLEITGPYHSPIVRPIDITPTKVISFNYALTCRHPEQYFVHFYIDDYQFERVWNTPTKYIELLKNFAGVIGPDFSAYTDLSMSQRIYNIYRNKALTAYWQKHGIKVIPNARWVDNCGLDFNNGFDGLPTHSTIAITTHSCFGETNYKIFQQEFLDIVNKLQPTQIVCIGKLPKEQQAICKQKNIKLQIFNSHIEQLEERRKQNGKSKKHK